MKELILKNNKLKINVILKMINDNEVISSTIFFDEPVDFSTIFPGRGILFGMPQQSQQPKNSQKTSRFPIRKGPSGQTDLPDWLTKDLKRRKNGGI